MLLRILYPKAIHCRIWMYLMDIFAFWILVVMIKIRIRLWLGEPILLALI